MQIDKIKYRITLIFLFCLFSLTTFSQESRLVRQTISSNGGSSLIQVNGENAIVHQSVGQSSAIGTINLGTSTIRQGFIQPYSNRSLAANPAESTLNVYPNPFLDFIKIQSNDWNNEMLTVRLFDLSGRIVKEDQIWAQETISCNWPDIEAGQYILQVTWVDHKSSLRTNISTILKL